jgi:hypothetical protein
LLWAGAPLVWLARQVTPPPPRGPAGNVVAAFVGTLSGGWKIPRTRRTRLSEEWRRRSGLAMMMSVFRRVASSMQLLNGCVAGSWGVMEIREQVRLRSCLLKLHSYLPVVPPVTCTLHRRGDSPPNTAPMDKRSAATKE